jgi:hypothetical protein
LVVLDSQFDPGQSARGVVRRRLLACAVLVAGCRTIFVQNGADFQGRPAQVEQLHGVVLAAFTQPLIFTLEIFITVRANMYM